MNQSKRIYNRQKEKNEAPAVMQKKEEVWLKPVKCISCNKIVAEIVEILMGRMLVKCKHCGMKNTLDHTTNITKRGKYIV